MKGRIRRSVKCLGRKRLADVRGLVGLVKGRGEVWDHDLIGWPCRGRELCRIKGGNGFAWGFVFGRVRRGLRINLRFRCILFRRVVLRRVVLRVFKRNHPRDAHRILIALDTLAFAQILCRHRCRAEPRLARILIGGGLCYEG